MFDAQCYNKKIINKKNVNPKFRKCLDNKIKWLAKDPRGTKWDHYTGQQQILIKDVFVYP